MIELACASRRKRWVRSMFLPSSDSISSFTAQRLSVTVLRASYTAPMPPAPRTRPSSYFPASVKPCRSGGARVPAPPPVLIVPAQDTGRGRVRSEGQRSRSEIQAHTHAGQEEDEGAEAGLAVELPQPEVLSAGEDADARARATQRAPATRRLGRKRPQHGDPDVD